jgi:hypothetical protein
MLAEQHVRAPNATRSLHRRGVRRGVMACCRCAEATHPSITTQQALRID